MSSKPRLATCSLAGCFGCHMSVLDLDLALLDVAAMVEFDRSPVNDLKRFRGRCAIGIVEGGCCNEENVHVLEEFRKNCDVLIALGDCAISGGIPAMRNNVPLRECLEQAYLAAPGLWNPAAVIPNDPELPLLLNRTYPCSEVVKVDVSIPGCPPPADAIGQALTAALSGRPMKLEYGVLKYD